MKKTIISIPEADHKIQNLIQEIAELGAIIKDETIRSHKTDILREKLKLLSEYIVKSCRLTDIEKSETGEDGCINLKKLLKTFPTLQERLLYELGFAAIKNNNIEYAIFIFNNQGPISLSLTQEAITSNRLDCLLKIIRSQISHKIMTVDHLEMILEMILRNRKATTVAEAIMIEFPSLISEQFLMRKYICLGNMDLLNHFMEEHHNSTFEMSQNIYQITQEIALDLNFDVANALYKKGIDVWKHKINYLQKKLSEEKNIIKISGLNFDIQHVRNMQLSFWRQVIDHDRLDQVTDMIKYDKPNDQKFIKSLINLFVIQACSDEAVAVKTLLNDKKVNETCPIKYKEFFEAIQTTYPDGSFDLDCASFAIALRWKDVLWQLLEKHSKDSSQTNLTFIEEVQLIALRKSKIDYSTNKCVGPADIAEEIGLKFSVDAPTKKIELLELNSSALISNKEDELKELRRCQEIQAVIKPSTITNIVQRFVYPLFNRTQTAAESPEPTDCKELYESKNQHIKLKLF